MIISYNRGGPCTVSPTVPATNKAEGGTPITLTATVGRNGKNVPADVTKIQQALNRMTPAQGGPPAPIKVDGICGEQTKNTIQKFQLKHFGWSGADSLVEPGKQTLGKLNSLQLAGGSASAGSGGAAITFSSPLNPDEAVKTIIAIGHAQQAVVRALQVLNRALKSSIYAFQNKPFIRYLKLDEAAFDERPLHIQRLIDVFTLILNILNKQGTTDKYFERADYERPHAPGVDVIAFCIVCGAHSAAAMVEDPKVPGKRVSNKKIYLCDAFFTLSVREQALTVIHELAHHCSTPTNQIGDVAYEGDALLDVIGYAQAIKNADSVALFACAC